MQKISFVCDFCEQNYLGFDANDPDINLDMPPGWMGVQIVLADSEGLIPEHEQQVIRHFCSKQCLAEYIRGEEFKRRIAMVDQSRSKEQDGDNEDDDDT